MPFTSEEVANASNCPLANVEANWPGLYQTMKKYGFGDTLNCIGMIGTVAKESASSFEPVREAFYIYDQDPVQANLDYLANPGPADAWFADTSKHAAYQGGAIYHGRGYIQSTHIGNYQKVADETGLDCVGNPDLLLQPAVAAVAACIYWRDHGISAMCAAQDWASVRRAIYGGNDPDGIARIKAVYNALG